VWQALARRLGTNFEYVECRGVVDKLIRLKEGSIDIAIGGITITEEREAIFDFTYPIYHTGLDILIPKVGRSTVIGLLSALFEGQKFIFFAALIILIIIAGHIIWLVERSSKRRATSFHQKYVPGVFERVDDAIDALLKAEVEAVVYDAPNLLYYANKGGQGKVSVVGKIFEPQDYGLALPQGSSLREKINLAILSLVESGDLARIKLIWFGA
jgi:glutamine transport system substrate-binding protein